MALFNNKEPEKNSKPQPTLQPVAPTPAPTPKSDERAAAARPAAPAVAPAPAGGGQAYLDRGSKVSGKLSFDGPARIDGQVDGEITGKDSVMVGEGAVLTAQIRAGSIIVAGKVSGDIHASSRIEIRPSARVLGNLTSPVIVVHEGALFEGHCSMQPEGAREERKITVLPKEERVTQSLQAGGQKPA